MRMSQKKTRSRLAKDKTSIRVGCFGNKLRRHRRIAPRQFLLDHILSGQASLRVRSATNPSKSNDIQCGVELVPLKQHEG